MKDSWLVRALRVYKSPSYRTTRWFFDDFVMRYRWRLCMITLVGLAAAGLQGATLAALNSVIRMSPGDSFAVPVLELSLAPGQVVPVAAGFIILALGLSAALGFVQAREVLELWRRYQAHAVNALLEAVSRAISRGAVDEASIRSAPVVVALRQSQRLGAFTRLVAGGITPALRFIVFSGVAIALNPHLTIILFMVAIPSGCLTLLLFARSASRNMRRVVELGKDAGQDLKQRLALAVQHQSVSENTGSPIANSPFFERANALTRRILFIEQAKFTTATIALLVSGAFVLYGGYSGALDAANWSQEFAYLLALILAFNQLSTLASMVSGFGSFYPAVAMQKEMLGLLDQANSPDHFRQMLQKRGLKSAAVPDEEDML